LVLNPITYVKSHSHKSKVEYSRNVHGQTIADIHVVRFYNWFT